MSCLLQFSTINGLLSSSRCTSTPPIPVFEASHHISKALVKSTAAKLASASTCACSSLKHRSSSAPKHSGHLTGFSFCSSRVSGLALSANPSMNCRCHPSTPRHDCSSSRFRGGARSLTASILSSWGRTEVCDTSIPSIFTSFTKKSHFVAFNSTPCSLSRVSSLSSTVIWLFTPSLSCSIKSST